MGSSQNPLTPKALGHEADNSSAKVRTQVGITWLNRIRMRLLNGESPEHIMGWVEHSLKKQRKYLKSVNEKPARNESGAGAIPTLYPKSQVRGNDLPTEGLEPTRSDLEAQSTPIQSSIDRMRFELMTLDKLRQTHQIDNPEYIDTIIDLFNKQILAELKALKKSAAWIITDDHMTNYERAMLRKLDDRINELEKGAE